MNKELEGTIENIKTFIEDYKIAEEVVDGDFIDDLETILQALEKYKNMYNAEHQIHLVRNEQLDRKEIAVQKAKELEIENQKLKEALENSIPKQLVKEKIEELKKQSGGNVFHVQQTINSNIRLLQELLEGK